MIRAKEMPVITETTGENERPERPNSDLNPTKSAGSAQVDWSFLNDDGEPWEAFCPDVVPLIPVGATLSASTKIDPAMVGKIPGKLLVDGWCGLPAFTTYQSSSDQIATWREQGAGFGIVGRRFPAIDIDITDEPLAEAVMQLAFKMLGPAPVRTGRAPKRLLMYSGTIAKRLRVTLADGQMVEVLGGRGHYVVEGIHPKTGKPYWWASAGKSGENPHPDDLTHINEQQVDAFLQAAERLCVERGFAIKPRSVAGSATHTGSGHVPGNGRPRSNEEMEDLLHYIDPDEPNEPWFNNVAAIKSTPLAVSQSAIPPHLRTESEDHNLELVLRWSRGEFSGREPSRYTGDEDVVRAYDRIDPHKPGGRGIAGLERIAEANGWQRPEKPSAEFEPMDLLGNITPEPKLTRDMLPAAISNLAWDASERMGIAPDILVAAMLVTCAAATDDAIRIQPKRHDTTWTESARLNFLYSAPSGSIKTAALDTATAPLEKLDHDWQAEDGRKIARWKAREEERKAARKQPRSAVPPAVVEEMKPSSRKVPLDEIGKDEPQPDIIPEKRPEKRRAVITDNTVEGTARILKDNPRGLLLKVDEVVGWLAGFDADRSGKGGKDRAFWLQADNGGAYRKDRANEEASFEVPNLSVSIIGGIQPRKLRGLVDDLHDDGLIQRSFVILTETAGDGLDRIPDQAAIMAYDKLVNRLANLNLNADWDGAVTFSEEAHEHREAIDRLARAFIRNPNSPDAFKEHLGKWRGRFARLALLFHLIEGEGLVVSGETAARVRNFMTRFLLPHQIRFYHDYFQSASQLNDDVRWIAGYILAHKSEKITKRDLQRASYKPANLNEAMEHLMQTNWITGKYEDLVKRTTGWLVNPRVHELFTETAEAERQRRDAIKRQIAEATRVRKGEGFE